MGDPDELPSQERLADAASGVVWKIEKRGVRSAVISQLQNGGRFAPSITETRTQVTGNAFASLIWLRRASFRVIPALILWVLGARVHESIGIDALEVLLWVLAGVFLSISMQRCAMAFRAKKQLTQP